MQSKKWNSKQTIVVYIMIGLVFAVLVYDAAATEILNHRYRDAVSYNAERRYYFEKNGNEYITSGECTMISRYIGAAVQIFHVYYDEEHPAVSVLLDIREDKFGRREYMLGFDDDGVGWGGYVYIDKNGNPISKYGESVNKEALEMMLHLEKEVRRVVELANLRWKLNLSLNYLDSNHKE